MTSALNLLNWPRGAHRAIIKEACLTLTREQHACNSTAQLRTPFLPMHSLRYTWPACSYDRAPLTSLFQRLLSLFQRLLSLLETNCCSGGTTGTPCATDAMGNCCV